MDNEALILDQLERLEQAVAPVTESAKSVNELKEQLAPRVNEAVQALIVELADVEADFQLEDLTFFVKKLMRNVKNLTYLLEQLKNLIDFARAVEPLLKTTVPHVISTFDDLEQKGLLGLVTKFPAHVDLSKAQEVGLFGILQALREKEVRQGLGVLLELTRGLSAVKV